MYVHIHQSRLTWGWMVGAIGGELQYKSIDSV